MCPNCYRKRLKNIIYGDALDKIIFFVLTDEYTTNFVCPFVNNEYAGPAREGRGVGGV